MALALLYFAGPLIVAIEQLRPVFWIPLLLLAVPWVVSLDAFLLPRRPSGGGSLAPRWPGRRIVAGQLALFGAGAAWILLSGIGGFAACRWDYIKHNFIFSSLLQGNLPILIDGGAAGPVPLSYYFAYYIVPVRLLEGLRTILPFLTLDQVLVALYATTLFMAVRVLAARLRVGAAMLLLLLVLTGTGLDLVGVVLFDSRLYVVGQVPRLDLPIWRGVEWWGAPLAPESLTMHLFWAPQHFFAALIGVALIVSTARLERPAGERVLHCVGVIAAAVFWSPYVAVGLAVVAAGELLRPGVGSLLRALAGGLEAPAWRLAPAAAFYLLLSAFMLLYFAAARPSSPPTSIFAAAAPGAWLVTFLINHTPWLAALAVLVGWHVRINGSDDALLSESRRELAWTLGFGLAASALLLCFRHGTYNDWGLRTILPLGIVLTAATGRLLAMPLPAAGRLAIVGLLVVSSASSLTEIELNLFAPAQCAPYGAYQAKDLGELLPQYEADPSALLYRYFSRSP